MSKKKMLTFTKIALIAIVGICLIDMQMPFILSFLGKDPVTDYGKVIASAVVGVFIGYCCKSFFETKEEEKNKIIKEGFRVGDITGFDDAEILDTDEEVEENG